MLDDALGLGMVIFAAVTTSDSWLSISASSCSISVRDKRSCWCLEHDLFLLLDGVNQSLEDGIGCPLFNVVVLADPVGDEVLVSGGQIIQIEIHELSRVKSNVIEKRKFSFDVEETVTVLGDIGACIESKIVQCIVESMKSCNPLRAKVGFELVKEKADIVLYLSIDDDLSLAVFHEAEGSSTKFATDKRDPHDVQLLIFPHVFIILFNLNHRRWRDDGWPEESAIEEGLVQVVLSNEAILHLSAPVDPVFSIELWDRVQSTGGDRS